jgi:peptidoglycan/LPS O-acetylase OafA/YrhL
MRDEFPMQASSRPLARVRPAIDALTSIRFFAAFYVAIFHWAKLHPHKEWPALVRNAAFVGYIGVPMFFVLSGFILSYNYAPREDREHLDKRGFWVARFARIYPVYAFGLVAALPFFLKDLAKVGRLDVAHVTLIGGTATTLTQAWSPATACKWNCPGWTLSVEAFFYALFPFLLAPLLLLPVRKLLAVATATWLVALMGPTYVALGLPAHGALEFYVSMTPLARLPEFVIGMALGLVFLRTISTNPKPVPRGVGTAAAGVAAIALAGLILTSSRIPEILLRTSLATPLFATIIVALALDTGRLQRSMSWPVLVLLGEASYALYIIHVPVGSYLNHGTRIIAGHRITAGLDYGLLYLALSVAASVILLHFFEQPARRALRRRLVGFAYRDRDGVRRPSRPSEVVSVQPETAATSSAAAASPPPGGPEGGASRPSRRSP